MNSSYHYNLYVLCTDQGVLYINHIKILLKFMYTFFIQSISYNHTTILLKLIYNNFYSTVVSFLIAYNNFIFKLNTILYFFWLLIISIIFMLILTLIIAAITLVERKTLALVQRRVGPNQTAFRGRLQFIADALKLLNKSIFVLRDTKRTLFVLWPMLALVAAYLFWINAIWGPNLALAHIEYNLLVMGVLSFFFSLSIVLVSVYSKNKYCILAAVRSALLTATLELVWGIVVIIIISNLESFSFTVFLIMQTRTFILILLLAPAAPFVLLIFLLETSRIPFDLVEAESELVAGYSNELGGFFFALFYLGEYFHLFFASLFFGILFFGI